MSTVLVRFDGAAAVNIIDVEVLAKWCIQWLTWVIGGKNNMQVSQDRKNDNR